MAKRATGPQAESEYARAAWEAAAEPLEEGGFLTQVSQYPTGRVGVWGITVRLLHCVDGKPGGIVAQVKGEWPNSQNVSYWGYVWSLQIRVAESVTADTEALLREGLLRAAQR